MPIIRETLSKRAWRRQMAAQLVDRLDTEGELRYVGNTPQDRREMLKIAALLPEDVVAELYEDPALPGQTFMELRHLPEDHPGQGRLRMTYDDRRDQAV